MSKLTELLYKFSAGMWRVLDYVRNIVFWLAGMHTEEGKEDVLIHFLLAESVKKSFYVVVLMGFITVFIFTVTAIIKNAVKDTEYKETNGEIVVKSMKSVIMFMAVPFVVLVFILLSSTIMSSVNNGMSTYIGESGKGAAFGGELLVLAGSDAYIFDPMSREYIESMFVKGELSYSNLSVVSTYYNIENLNYFICIFGGGVMLVMISISAIIFVQRIFDVILLYIVSPMVASTMPEDGGARFSTWREMIVSKVIGAYGVILSLNLFFLFMPEISNLMSSGDRERNGIIKLLFLIGGTFSVTKANMIISEFSGKRGAVSEMRQTITNLRTAYAISRTTGGIVQRTVGGILGGKAYYKNREQGYRGLENLQKISQKSFSDITECFGKKQRKTSRITQSATRIATLPLGIAKDIISGGLVRMAKHIPARIDNIAHGSGFINRPTIEFKNKVERKPNKQVKKP